MDWQPIETAPKDGSKVILAWGGKSVVGSYLDNSKKRFAWQGWTPMCNQPFPQGAPTHWMPLPPPPTLNK